MDRHQRGDGHVYRKILNRRTARILGLLAFIATGGGLIYSTAIREVNYYKTEILIIYGALFAVSLLDHFVKLTRREENHEDS